jgi:hypothetical protein
MAVFGAILFFYADSPSQLWRSYRLITTKVNGFSRAQVHAMFGEPEMTEYRVGGESWESYQLSRRNDESFTIRYEPEPSPEGVNSWVNRDQPCRWDWDLGRATADEKIVNLAKVGPSLNHQFKDLTEIVSLLGQPAWRAQDGNSGSVRSSGTGTTYLWRADADGRKYIRIWLPNPNPMYQADHDWMFGSIPTIFTLSKKCVLMPAK